MDSKKLAGKYASLFSNRITTRKSLPLSYASLFLAILILITGTVSWFTVHDTANINSDDFKFESATGLRVNDGEDLTNHIKLENFTLEEASSVDGRNFFFPTTGTFDSNTALMKFREGNVGDKNQKYAYKDFTLSGQYGTAVYIKDYSIRVGDETFDGSTKIEYDAAGLPSAQIKHKKCPVRIAFISDSCETPKLFDPTALIDEYSMKCDAVNTADALGTPTTQQSIPEAFGTYYFVTGSPLYTIQNEPINVTMVVWLEGTGENWESYAGKTISVDVELESNWSDMETIRLVDDTIGDTETYHPWITDKFEDADPIVIMAYKDTKANNQEKFVVMTFKGAIADKSGSTTGQKLNCWEAPIPKYVTTDIAFYRYNPKQEEIFNAWYTKKGVNDLLNPAIKNDPDWIPKYGDLQESRVIDGKRQLVYTAVRGNKYSNTDKENERLSPGLGYWGYVAGQTSTGGGGTGGGSGTTGDVKLGIYFNINDNIQNKINQGYKLYVVINGVDSYELTKIGDKRYIKENLLVNAGSNITKFILKNSENKQEIIPLDNAYSVMSSINYTFTMQDNGTAHGQS